MKHDWRCSLACGATRFPLSFVSRRQDAVSHSNPEAETSTWPGYAALTLYEDNPATVHVCEPATHPTMRDVGSAYCADLVRIWEMYQGGGPNGLHRRS